MSYRKKNGFINDGPRTHNSGRTHSHTQQWMHPPTHTHTHAQQWTHTLTHNSGRTHSHTQQWMHTHTHNSGRTHPHTHTHNTHAHTHTHTHTHFLCRHGRACTSVSLCCSTGRTQPVQGSPSGHLCVASSATRCSQPARLTVCALPTSWVSVCMCACVCMCSCTHRR